MATDQQDPDADQESRADRKERYQSVLSAIYHNTGDPNPPLIRASVLWTTVRHSNIRVADAERSLRAAREHDEVIRWRDGEGHWRYGLNDDGIGELPHYDAPIFGPDDEQALRDIIETEVQSADVDEEIVGWANRRLAAIDDRADDDPGEGEGSDAS